MRQHGPITKPFPREAMPLTGSAKGLDSGRILEWPHSEALTGTELDLQFSCQRMFRGGFDRHRNRDGNDYGPLLLGSYFRYLLRVHLSSLGSLGNCAQPQQLLDFFVPV